MTMTMTMTMTILPKQKLSISDRLLPSGQIWTMISENKDCKKKKKSTDTICRQVQECLPINHVHESFECRYKYHVGRGRSAQGMTKKQINMISAAASVAASSDSSSFDETEELRVTIDRILKQCVRCGSKYSRLMDSESLEKWMFYVDVEGEIMKDYTRDTTLIERRIFCAKVLAEDADRAGRFKRTPCMWLPPSSSIDIDNDNDETAAASQPSSSTATTTTLTLLNGGWTVVDQSVRAAAEARNFVDAEMKKGGGSGIGIFAADPNNERILCRLESLACGEKLRKQQRGGNGGSIKLEVDVRTVLETMNLPLSSEGAQEALIRMGRWTKTGSNTEDGKTTMQYERWSPEVLEAAKWYTHMDRFRRRTMKSEILKLRSENRKQKQRPAKKSSLSTLEGRTDLTNLPCICVDAQRVSFRDDAFGIRKRSSTGRKVKKAASEWELLFHIADVSDIFSPQSEVVGSPCASGTAAGQSTAAKTSIEDQKKHLQELKKAAQSRIRSEYNLPLGPLHLLPTNVLSSLSLDAFKQDWTSDPTTWPSSWQTMDRENGSVNRAVTLWVYIDERNGFILDMGFERSIISRPLALSFKTATNLLEASDEQQHKFPPMLAKARVLLSKVEQNIQKYNEYRMKTQDSARAREKKLASREFVSNQVYRGRNNRRRDDGSDGFQRSRGHKLVDSILECYESAFRMMIRKRKALVPHHQGLNNDGRSASSPLRTYLHGLAQRQALSILCGYGGEPINDKQCKEIGQSIRNAYTARQHVGGAIKGPKAVSKQQLEAVRSLDFHLQNHPRSRNRVVPAISTGVNSEVVIQGVGAIALCKEVPGTIARGVKVMVKILEVDGKNGKLVVALDSII
uniref:RNB domain-containing protein n=1 Tax=Pseudo-nitzschia australis TaxID=44445 RepID=A0A7S4EQK3_9STRA